MNNPWYNRINKFEQEQGFYAQPQPAMNPIQQMNMVNQAMHNPAAFLKRRFPDIPDDIMGNPNQILSYLQKTRGITDQDIQNVRNSIPSMPGW